MKINGKIFFILLFLSCVGICAGSFFEVGLGAETKVGLSSALDSIFSASAVSDERSTDENASYRSEFISAFLSLLRANILPAVLGFLSGIIVILLPLIPSYILLKGISVGFSAAAMFEAFGAKAILYILLTLMPQNLIQLPLWCLLGTLSLQFGGSVSACLLAAAVSRFRSSDTTTRSPRSGSCGRPAISAGSTRSIKKKLRVELRSYIAAYLLCAFILCFSCAIQAFLLLLAF